MHSVVINLIQLLKLDYLISNARKEIRINRNESIFEKKMHSLGIDLI